MRPSRELVPGFQESKGEPAMGARGPLPDPGSSNTAKRRNTYFRPAVAVTTTRAPRPPAAVAARPAALAFWRDHAGDLAARGRLTGSTAAMFGVLCALVADVADLAAVIASDGWTIDGKPHPAARLLRDARRDVVALATSFGLTPAGEARLPVDPPDEEDDDAAALRAFTGPPGAS